MPKGSSSQYRIETDNYADSYFKLKINNLDDRYEFSKIIRIKSNCSKTDFQIQPNPSNGNFKLVLTDKSNISVVKVLIRNELGELVYIADASCYNGVVALDLNSKLINGVYTVTCLLKGETLVKKLIVIK